MINTKLKLKPVGFSLTFLSLPSFTLTTSLDCHKTKQTLDCTSRELDDCPVGHERDGGRVVVVRPNLAEAGLDSVAGVSPPVHWSTASDQWWREHRCFLSVQVCQIENEVKAGRCWCARQFYLTGVSDRG